MMMRQTFQPFNPLWPAISDKYRQKPFPNIPDEETRRPGQRPATSMLGNEVLNKEQLYDLFQQILGVKKFEHQLLYNAMQVINIASHILVVFSLICVWISQLESADEQAAAIRRELDARREKLQEMQRVRKLNFSYK